MEPVNGYLAFDGKFFHSEEECHAYENKFQHEIRRRAVIEFFGEGMYLSNRSTVIPKDLQEHVAAIPEDDLIELWNQHLLPLFFVEVEQKTSLHSVIHEIPETGGTRSTTDPVDFFVMKSEAAYRLLAFVLDKNP